MKIIVFIVTFGVFVYGSEDPCDTPNILHRSEDRGTRCSLDHDSSQVCDRYAVNATWWYKVVSGNKTLEMATATPDLNKCGTSFPIWMNVTDTLSVANGSEETRTACMHGLGGPCVTKYDVRVKNCGHYYVYKLQDTNTCDTAYCFGNDTCPGQDGISTATPTSASPITTAPSVAPSVTPSVTVTVTATPSVTPTVTPTNSSINASTPTTAVEDPCNTTHNLHRPNERGTNCSVTVNPICDRYAVDEDVWYKAQTKQGEYLALVTQTPDLNACGTSYPVWMNGTYPAKGAVVNRTVCVRGISDPCVRTYNITVKTCDKFYVYRLKQTSVCDAAYCFGQDRRCHGKTLPPKLHNHDMQLTSGPFLLLLCTVSVWLIGNLDVSS